MKKLEDCGRCVILRDSFQSLMQGYCDQRDKARWERDSAITERDGLRRDLEECDNMVAKLAERIVILEDDAKGKQEL